MALFTNLLHPTDFSRDGVPAFVHALRLAVAFRANLDLLHADRADENAGWAEFPGVRDTLSLWGMLPPRAPPEAVAALGLGIRKVRMRDADPVRAIGAAARSRDLLVLATHGRTGVNRLLRGSVAEEASREARVPTLFVPYQARGFVDAATGTVHLRRILVPVHLDPDGIEVAAELVHRLGVPGGRLRILHIAADGAAPPAGPYPPVPGWDWETEGHAGAVIPAVLEVAEQWAADLVVMATRGHDSVGDTLLGSTMERVLRQSPCPVLSVPVPT